MYTVSHKKRPPSKIQTSRFRERLVGMKRFSA
jgi:hypothetical protein